MTLVGPREVDVVKTTWHIPLPSPWIWISISCNISVIVLAFLHIFASSISSYRLGKPGQHHGCRLQVVLLTIYVSQISFVSPILPFSNLTGTLFFGSEPRVSLWHPEGDQMSSWCAKHTCKSQASYEQSVKHSETWKTPQFFYCPFYPLLPRFLFHGS